MRQGVRLISILLLAVCFGGTFLGVWAQDAPTTEETTEGEIISADQCGVAISQFWLNASDACVGKPFGYVCNGGVSPYAEPQGAVSNSLATLGALVEIQAIDAIHTTNITPTANEGGIVWVRVSAEDSPLRFSGLAVGDVQLEDITPEGFPAWQSFTVQTVDAADRCELSPHSAFIVQSLPNQSSRVVINGISLDVNGTTVIQTEGDLTHFMSISGTLTLLTAGQRNTIYAGQEVAVSYEAGNFAMPISAPGIATNFREERVKHLPILLFDFPVQVPQAGIATTLGGVNLRTAPTTDAAILLQAPAGERLTLLGRNPDSDWFHVQMGNGQTGWMYAELLNVGADELSAVYVETPQPLQRLGELGQLAQVIAPNGVTLRSAPDVTFPAVAALPFGLETTLLNRSPYSPWVKVETGGQVGWVPLITLETRAIIDALPIDYNVPPPPEPTRIPGSFGNAFPNPNCYPNC